MTDRKWLERERSIVESVKEECARICDLAPNGSGLACADRIRMSAIATPLDAAPDAAAGEVDAAKAIELLSVVHRGMASHGTHGEEALNAYDAVRALLSLAAERGTSDQTKAVEQEATAAPSGEMVDRPTPSTLGASAPCLSGGELVPTPPLQHAPVSTAPVMHETSFYRDISPQPETVTTTWPAASITGPDGVGSATGADRPPAASGATPLTDKMLAMVQEHPEDLDVCKMVPVSHARALERTAAELRFSLQQIREQQKEDFDRSAKAESERDELRKQFDQLGELRKQSISAREEMRRDAERYRWLRDLSAPGVGEFYLAADKRSVAFAREEIDTAIDAALAAQKEKT